jgi:hypothetical protein
MTQSTLQQTIYSISLSQVPKGELETSLYSLIRPWLVITDLELKDVLRISVQRIWEDLQNVQKGLSSFLSVMGDTVTDEDLREAACRLIGRIEISGDIADTDIGMPQNISIIFENGVWTYYTDPKLRLKTTKVKYKTALAEVRELLDAQSVAFKSSECG